MTIRFARCTLAVLVLLAVAASIPRCAIAADDAATLLRRSQQSRQAGNYPAALANARKLEALVRAAKGVDHPDYAAALNNLGLADRALGNYAEAEPLHLRALAIYQKLNAGSADAANTLDL